MKTAKEFAKERLKKLWATPRMWAVTKEAYIAQVSLLVELILEEAFDPQAFYKKTLGLPNSNSLIGLNSPVTEEWASSVFLHLPEDILHE